MEAAQLHRDTTQLLSDILQSIYISEEEAAQRKDKILDGQNSCPNLPELNLAIVQEQARNAADASYKTHIAADQCLAQIYGLISISAENLPNAEEGLEEELFILDGRYSGLEQRLAVLGVQHNVPVHPRHGAGIKFYSPCALV
jgi:hypothetical protein